MVAPAAPAEGDTAGGLRRDLLVLLALVIAGRLAIAGVAALYLAGHPDDPAGSLAGVLCRWDCKWYVYVADHGYDPVARHWARGDGADWAFFPLLPLLMRAVALATGLSTRSAGFVVSTAAFALAVAAFHLYARDLRGPAFARHAGALLALWPFSIHAGVPMSEAVYLPASILAVLLARRGRWIAAGVAAAALSASRAVGVLGVLPLLAIALEAHGWRALARFSPPALPALVALALSGFGLGLFMVHLWMTTGDALAFSHVQTAWGRSFAWPWRMVIDELSPWRWDGGALLRHGVHLATALAGLSVAAVLIRRRLWPEAAFVYATFALALTAGAAMSLARFTGALFPLVLAVALLTDRPGRRGPALAASAALSLTMTWIWVALYNYGM